VEPLTASEAYIRGCHDVKPLGRGRREDAIGLLERATELDPLAAFAWIALSRSNFALGYIDEAISPARKGPAISPNQVWGH